MTGIDQDNKINLYSTQDPHCYRPVVNYRLFMDIAVLVGWQWWAQECQCGRQAAVLTAASGCQCGVSNNVSEESEETEGTGWMSQLKQTGVEVHQRESNWNLLFILLLE